MHCVNWINILGRYEYRNAFEICRKMCFCTPTARSVDFLLCAHYSFCSFDSFRSPMFVCVCVCSSAFVVWFSGRRAGNGRERKKNGRSKRKKRENIQVNMNGNIMAAHHDRLHQTHNNTNAISAVDAIGANDAIGAASGPKWSRRPNPNSIFLMER